MANVRKCEFMLRPAPRLLPRKRWLQPVASECFPHPFTSVYWKQEHSPKNGCDKGDFQSESDGTPEDGEIICENEADRAGEPQARKVILSRDGEQTLGEILHSEGVCISEDSELLSSSPNSTSCTDRVAARLSQIADSGPCRQLETLLSRTG
ncbi:hypothetical protein FIBSPDRAFT_857678, partial [Athelia psychrophila]